MAPALAPIRRGLAAVMSAFMPLDNGTRDGEAQVRYV